MPRFYDDDDDDMPLLFDVVKHFFYIAPLSVVWQCTGNQTGVLLLLHSTSTAVVNHKFNNKCDASYYFSMGVQSLKQTLGLKMCLAICDSGHQSVVFNTAQTHCRYCGDGLL
jgi:hypothetical protein